MARVIKSTKKQLLSLMEPIIANKLNENQLLYARKKITELMYLSNKSILNDALEVINNFFNAAPKVEVKNSALGGNDMDIFRQFHEERADKLFKSFGG